MDSKTVSSKDTALRTFNETIEHDGIRAALAYLLSLSDFRFISIFRSHGDQSTAVVFYDRENPDVLRVDEVPSTATYCHIATKTKSVFSTDNSLEDSRLTLHAARESVQAYWGLPVITPEGEILGTLCQYDVVPRDVGQIDLALMVEVASTLEQKHLIPPYPDRPA